MCTSYLNYIIVEYHSTSSMARLRLTLLNKGILNLLANNKRICHQERALLIKNRPTVEFIGVSTLFNILPSIYIPLVRLTYNDW